MRRVIGFALFFTGIGMIIGLFIESVFWSVCIILGLLIIGYNHVYELPRQKTLIFC